MTDVVSIRRHARIVALVMNGELAGAFHWQAADDLARAIRGHAELAALGHPITGSSVTVKWGRHEATVRHEGASVIVLFRSRWVMRLPSAEASEVWQGIVAQARKCEEWEKADAVARDHAILFRSGAPFGLTSKPEIQDEAVRLAVHDRDLRRFLPGGIKSTVILGTPVVAHETRTTLEIARAAIVSMGRSERESFASQLQ